MAKRLMVTASVIVLFGACASAPSSKRALEMSEGFCTDPSFQRKLVFTLYSYVKTPIGVFVGSAGLSSTKAGKFGDDVANNFLKILSYRYFVPDKRGTSVATSVSRPVVMSDEGDSSGLRIAWVKDYTFVTWDAAYFPLDKRGLPLSKNEFIEVSAGPPFAGRMREAAFTKTFQNPDGCAFCREIEGSCDIYGCGVVGYNYDDHSLFAFILNTGFNLGGFLHSHYLSVPERDRSACQSGGMDDQCGASPTKVTKKIDGDWIISRIEFDPTSLCHYAKPTSDFITH